MEPAGGMGPSMSYTTESPNFRGVYSTQRTSFIGTGMTRRKTVQKRYWYVWETDGDNLKVQPLNQNMIPTGDKRDVEPADFVERFSREEDFFVQGGEARVRSIWRGAKEDQPPKPPQEVTIVKGKRGEEEEDGDPLGLGELGLSDKGSPEDLFSGVERDEEPFQEEESRAEALEKDARMDFGMGLSYLKQGREEEAKAIFRRLAEMDGEFVPEHKHMFNDFGMGLRKSNLPEEALAQYFKALELSPEDENLFCNIARAYFEQGQEGRATEYLEKALNLKPDFPVAKLFLQYLSKRRKRRNKGIL